MYINKFYLGFYFIFRQYVILEKFAIFWYNIMIIYTQKNKYQKHADFDVRVGISTH